MNDPRSWTTPRSRRQIATSTGVSIGVMRCLECDGLLTPGRLTLADEVVVRALVWADGARAGDRDHERALAKTVREVLAGSVEPDAVLVLVDRQVLIARDALEALLLVRGRRGAVTLLPVGTWIAELQGSSTERETATAPTARPSADPPAEAVDASRPVRVTRAQVDAAKGRIITDAFLGQSTPEWIRALARADKASIDYPTVDDLPTTRAASGRRRSPRV